MKLGWCGAKVLGATIHERTTLDEEEDELEERIITKRHEVSQGVTPSRNAFLEKMRAHLATGP